MTIRRLAALPLFLALAVAARAGGPIAAEEVHAAQKAWGDAIVAIGAAHAAGGDARALAERTVADLYGYDLGPVLFKPTKAAALEIPDTPAEAVSYFVGGEVPEDHGFALQPWSAVRFGEQQLAMPPEEAQAPRGVVDLASEMRQLQADGAASGPKERGDRRQVARQDLAFGHRSILPGRGETNPEGPVAQGGDAKRAGGVSLDEVRRHACVGRNVLGHDSRNTDV